MLQCRQVCGGCLVCNTSHAHEVQLDPQVIFNVDSDFGMNVFLNFALANDVHHRPLVRVGACAAAIEVFHTALATAVGDVSVAVVLQHADYLITQLHAGNSLCRVDAATAHAVIHSSPLCRPVALLEDFGDLGAAHELLDAFHRPGGGDEATSTAIGLCNLIHVLQVSSLQRGLGVGHHDGCETFAARSSVREIRLHEVVVAQCLVALEAQHAVDDFPHAFAALSRIVFGSGLTQPLHHPKRRLGQQSLHQVAHHSSVLRHGDVHPALPFGCRDEASASVGQLARRRELVQQGPCTQHLANALLLSRPVGLHAVKVLRLKILHGVFLGLLDGGQQSCLPLILEEALYAGGRERHDRLERRGKVEARQLLAKHRQVHAVRCVKNLRLDVGGVRGRARGLFCQLLGLLQHLRACTLQSRTLQVSHIHLADFIRLLLGFLQQRSQAPLHLAAFLLPWHGLVCVL
eukprot:m.135690 g.135690  ORF g.135690 m.135690 type:complete len:461 (-) comp20170_c0_seq2:128-1510(-)